MEKKTVLAIILCIAVWIIWSALFMEPPQKKQDSDGGTLDGSVADSGSTPAKAADPGGPGQDEGTQPAEAKPPTERLEERLVTVKNSLMEATFTSRGAALKSLKLVNYWERDETKPKDSWGPEDLVSTSDERHGLFSIRFRDEKTSFKLGTYTDWGVVGEGLDKVVFRYSNPQDPQVPEITKTFTIQPDSYRLELLVEIENRSEESVSEQIILDLFAIFQPPVQTGCMGAPAAPRSPMCMKGEELFPSSESMCAGAPQVNPGEQINQEPDIFWTGINEQYFLIAAVPVGVDQSFCQLSADNNSLLKSSLMYPAKDIPPGDKASHRFGIFAGPKQMALLKEVQGGPGEGNNDARLAASVDYGWFAVLCHPMLWLLKNFYSFVGNYGIAIIFLTIIIKILLLPLTHKSMKSMGEMTKLRPLMEELKKKHGEDKQKLNQEMMALYKAHKVNPAGGCFPMLLQMPIWIALYRMLYSSVELYQAPFIAGWLPDLSYRDPYFIMPIILGATMFLQQKLSPTTPDSQQAKMMLYVMPAFFTFIMLYLPSGLVLYIFVNSILSIGHQLIYNRMQNKPAAGEPAAPA